MPPKAGQAGRRSGALGVEQPPTRRGTPERRPRDPPRRRRPAVAPHAGV